MRCSHSSWGISRRQCVATAACKRGKSSGCTTAEAEKIAISIRGEVDAGRRTWGDFLILTRKKKNLEQYASALEALEIPVEVNGAGAFGDSREVRQLALLLNALADPQDAVSLVGVLRGPLRSEEHTSELQS